MELAAQFVQSLYLVHATAAVFFGLVFWRYSKRFERNYLGLWSRSWGALALHQLFAALSMAIALEADPLSPWRTLSTALSLSAVYAQVTWLLAGSYEIALNRLARGTLIRNLVFLCIGLGFVTAWVAHDTPGAGDSRLAMRVAIPAMLSALAFVGSATFLARLRWAEATLGLRVVICVFFINGLHLIIKGSLNLFPAVVWESVMGYAISLGLVDFLATCSVAVGLIMWMLEDEHRLANEATQRADRLASHDALTGLSNRSSFMEQLAQRLNSLRLPEERLAVGIVDLDRFKSINDALGHPAGDELLIRAGKILTGHLRDSDLVARLGDDEFAVVMAHVNDGLEAVNTAERLLDPFREPVTLAGREMQCTASIGLAVAPHHGDHAEQLIQRASTAARRAREGGGNTMVLYSADLSSRSAAELDFENELRRAIERGQFFLRYQPVINKPDDGIVSAESLLRWRHPARGELAPGDFLALAYQLGLAVEIDQWVLNAACTQARRWQVAGHELRTAINLSPETLEKPDFPASLERIIAQHQVDPSRLCLEITEHAAINDLEQGRKTLQRLQTMGVQVVIDDFGVGYSSFSHLNSLPVQGIKIDKCFIQRLDRDRREAAIVSAMISMALGLGLHVVAEGIETEFQEQFLVRQGCTHLQGFRYYEPLDVKELDYRLAVDKAVELAGTR